MRNEELRIYPRLYETTDPTTTNDITEGLSRASLWYNQVADVWYICNDSTTNNANWSALARLSDVDLTAVEASIASLGIQVSTNTGNISNLTTTVNSHTSSISSLTTQVNTNTSNIATNTVSIGNLITTTNTHTTQIAALQALITALQTRACGAMYISATSTTLS